MTSTEPSGGSSLRDTLVHRLHTSLRNPGRPSAARMGAWQIDFVVTVRCGYALPFYVVKVYDEARYCRLVVGMEKCGFMQSSSF